MRLRLTERVAVSILVLVLAAGVFGALSTGVGTAESPIDACTELDEEGETYELTADITDESAETCLEITADDITLDGMGHTIDGVDRVDDDSIGLYVSGADGVTVENVAVTGWDTGIELNQADDGAVRESEVTDNDWKGIYVVGTGATLTGNTVSGNGWDAIDFHPLSDDGTVTNNEVVGNHDGISISSDDTLVTDNVASDNDWSGITVVSASTTVTDNVADDNGITGLRLWAVEGTTLADNVARGNDNHGIELRAESHDNTLTDNRVRDSGTSDVRINQSDSNHFENLDIGHSTAANTTLTSTDGDGVKLSAVDSPPSHPDAESLDRFVEVVPDSTAPESRLTLSIHYTDDDVTDVDEETLAIWTYDGEWTEIESVVDPTEQHVTATSTEFSTVGLFPGEHSEVIDSADDDGVDENGAPDDDSDTGDDADGTTDDGADDTAPDDGAVDESDDIADTDDDADDDGPGFGVAIALAGLVGAGYLLQRLVGHSQ